LKISIVMSYYNRKKLLENTLYTIEKQRIKNLEIIIVDDASSPSAKIDQIIKNYDLDINLFEIDISKKTWINPCIPNNIGFSHASGDVIIIQNPECMHQGNILDHVLNNIKKNIYLNYACYSLNKIFTKMIVPDCILKMDDVIAHENGTNGWYNHSVIKPTGYHFCSAIIREDLYDLGGFDERYANGLAYDDNEFLHRIKKKNMIIKHMDFPFVYHQFHEGVADRSFVKEGMSINYKIYEKTLKDNNYDVKKYNKFYR
jgi:glycosyltransferase involved in cell wall biosynthesis